MKEEAWRQYDPAFHHISIEKHQCATENRPNSPSSSNSSLPYAPSPATAHTAFRRIRRDLTTNSCVLAMAYRVLHVHCNNEKELDADPPGGQMYKRELKSEKVLARAIHLLTLGAHEWQSVQGGKNDAADNNVDTRWRDLGGGDIGSVFYRHPILNPPNACDWIDMALMRRPDLIMNSRWYRGRETPLQLLEKIACEGVSGGFLGGIHPSLRTGAAWLVDFAVKFNPTAAATSVATGSKALSSTANAAKGVEGGGTKENKLERKKKVAAAKEKAIAAMKAQQAKFARSMVNDDNMIEISTPVRNRADPTGEGTEAMDFSPLGDSIMTSPIASSYQKSPYTPCTPSTPHDSVCFTPEYTSQHFGIRLLRERPQCIICGSDSDPIQHGEILGDAISNKASLDGEVMNEERALAFCGYSQASTVTINKNHGGTNHVGVHISICGHAIHKSCYDLWHHGDRLSERLEVKRREFRCPLCQRLSNCLIPFIDVGVDWTDPPSSPRLPSLLKLEKESPMQVDRIISLNDFLSTSEWCATRNGALHGDRKPVTAGWSTWSLASSQRKMPQERKSKFGKKELIGAWNAVLSRHLVKRQLCSSSAADCEMNSISPEKNRSNSATEVLRRFIDQVFDVGHRADVKRLGENELAKDFGEFRHHLREKAAYNEANHGKEMVDVSNVCLGLVCFD